VPLTDSSLKFESIRTIDIIPLREFIAQRIPELMAILATKRGLFARERAYTELEKLQRDLYKLNRFWPDEPTYEDFHRLLKTLKRPEGWMWRNLDSPRGQCSDFVHYD